MAKTIMVVDDDPDIRDTIKTVLEKNGYKVVTAINGDDCLKKLRKQKPNLVLMDIMMPGTPVKNIIPKIKANIKIAYLSVVGMSEVEKKGIISQQKNVVGVIQKPFSINDFVRKVKRLVG